MGQLLIKLVLQTTDRGPTKRDQGTVKITYPLQIAGARIAIQFCHMIDQHVYHV